LWLDFSDCRSIASLSGSGWMKHFFLACLFSTLLTAQSMQITEQLGKTVLYGDIALFAALG
jgi:hypothetical protein